MLSFTDNHIFALTMEPKVILDNKELSIILNRLCCELIEIHKDFSNTVLIGLQPRGIAFANRIHKTLKEDYQITDLKYGCLDITFFRDDFRRRDEPLVANKTQLDFLVEGKQVVLIDDVLYTGRSIRAALDALQSFGRPSSVELCVLIDRRFSRHLPIQPDFVGRKVDSVKSERVGVEWKEKEGKDQVLLMESTKG